VAKVLNDVIGIERGLMTTIHAYTNDQKILDQIHRSAPRPCGAHEHDPDHHRRRPRRGLVLPELKGKLDGSASACRRRTSRWST
jgi:glyceraldehyde 3-phosphate dehydrogenase